MVAALKGEPAISLKTAPKQLKKENRPRGDLGLLVLF
jgi:hypothetical protein